MNEIAEYNIRELVKRMRESGKRKFVMQLPEGLKVNSIGIIGELEKEGFEIIYSAEPTYGACDLALEEARLSGAEAIIHVGHSKFYNDIEDNIPVIYFPWKIEVDFSDMDISEIKENRVGLLTTIQHTQVMEEARRFFESKGKKAVIGGQILGCWGASAYNIEREVDAFVFLGSGEFHPFAIKTEKPVYLLDVERKAAKKIDGMLWEKRRWASICRAKDAHIFGILVSTKIGQRELLGTAKAIKERIEEKQKNAIIIYLDEITEEKLKGIKVDAFVNTACPRLTDGSFDKPIINAADLGEVLKESF